MTLVYELYYNDGKRTVYCGDTTDENEARRECALLSQEFPEHNYWIEECFECPE